MTSPPLHTLGLHANQMSRAVANERMQTIMQWVGVGSVIMMGLGATVHLFKDLFKGDKEPFPKHRYRELQDELDRHHERHGRER